MIILTVPVKNSRIIKSIFRFVIFFVTWLLGVCVGIYLFRSAQTVFISLMRSASHASVSIVGKLSIIIFPLFTAAVAAFCLEPSVVLIACFIKAVVFTIASLSCYGAFAESGWFFQMLILFLDNCSVMIMLIISSSLFIRRTYLSGKIFVCYLVAWFLLLSIDIIIVDPYLVAVLN